MMRSIGDFWGGGGDRPKDGDDADQPKDEIDEEDRLKESSLNNSSSTKPIYLGFNQDFTCFACGLQNGFQVWSTNPLKQRFHRELDGGIGLIELLFRCNIVGIVGGGARPYDSTTKVLIWDDYQGRAVGELAFKKDVKAIRLRRDRVVVALETKVYVYNFEDLKLIANYDTAENPRGLIGVAANEDADVLVCLGNNKQTVRVVRGNRHLSIQAQKSAVGALALNTDGSRLATVSENGTVIRVWNTLDGTMISETRRGAQRKTVSSLNFNGDSQWLVAASEGGTLHVIDTSGERAPTTGWGMIPVYGTSKFSFAQIHLPNVQRCICAFDADDNIVAVSDDGTYHLYSFDKEKGGEGQKIEDKLFC